ncbi:MAG TPA: hypothetical protein PK728_08265 [Bacillota bacterium]|nr:hypothetical protein [Bacillota bacterium]
MGGNEKECNCCIKIEDSFVLIVCGELDVDNLKKSFKTFIEVKDNSKVLTQE